MQLVTFAQVSKIRKEKRMNDSVVTALFLNFRRQVYLYWVESVERQHPRGSNASGVAKKGLAEGGCLSDLHRARLLLNI